jgi:AraC-like DNA-binding protein
MSALEAGLRGGAIALFLLLAITGWRDARRAPAGRLTVLFDLCGIAYLIETVPPLAAAHPPWIVPIQLLSMATPAVFLHWAAANFNDFFVPAWWRWLPFAGMIALAAFAIATDWTPAWRAAQIAALLLVVAGIARTLAGRATDLVETRRRFRLAFAIGAGLWIAALTALGAAASPNVRAAAGPVTAGGILAFVLAAALMRLRLAPGASALAQAAPAGGPPSAASAAIDREDRALLDRLQALMEHDRIYRQEGFGLAMLARRLGIPEYRLRRLVNQRLGHRNFISFANGYRLAEAMAALADPGQRQVPILTIALDTGFQSIGPFNRAFKAHTGLTPTEFRRERSDGARMSAG